MPSSPNYKRNYKQEAATESQERKNSRRMRVAARYAFEKALGHPIPAGMDVDHKKELGKGGTNAPSNLHLAPAKKNRSYPRTRTGKMK